MGRRQADLAFAVPKEFHSGKCSTAPGILDEALSALGDVDGLSVPGGRPDGYRFLYIVEVDETNS